MFEPRRPSPQTGVTAAGRFVAPPSVRSATATHAGPKVPFVLGLIGWCRATAKSLDTRTGDCREEERPHRAVRRPRHGPPLRPRHPRIGVPHKVQWQLMTRTRARGLRGGSTTSAALVGTVGSWPRCRALGCAPAKEASTTPTSGPAPPAPLVAPRHGPLPPNRASPRPRCQWGRAHHAYLAEPTARSPARRVQDPARILVAGLVGGHSGSPIRLCPQALNLAG